MRAGVHPADRADGVARSDQQDRPCDPGLLRCFGDVGGRDRYRRRCAVAVLALLDSIRLSAWLLFAVALVTIRAGDGAGIGRVYLPRSAGVLPRRDRR